MKTYTLKSVARRGSMLGAAFAIVAASFVPAVTSYADALNPLTERSLTLSSSSPGWSYKDGSGNTTYAEPNSGANGKQTGNTFSFRVSTDSSATGTNTPIKAFSFQYCTTSAGNCKAPGDNAYIGTEGAYTGRKTNAASEVDKKSDLELVFPSAQEMSTASYGSLMNATTGSPTDAASFKGSLGNYVVMYKATKEAAWTQSTGWGLTASSKQTGTVADGTATDKNNYMELTSTDGLGLPAGAYVKIIFFGTADNYITNPGSKEFYVKINTYKSEEGRTDADIIDGGVTVANIMNRSIEIQTKVLETMAFSVGTVDPNTLTGAQLSTATSGTRTTHSTCDNILPSMTPGDKENILQMGDANAEFSLRTDTTYSTHSYWRLSSNSSAGATVYYSGVTLSNTVGDQIDAIGVTAKEPTRGGEQFGLALDNGDGTDVVKDGDDNVTDGYYVSYAKERDGTNQFQNGADNAVAGVDPSVTTDIAGNLSYHTPKLYPLLPSSTYAQGTGNINSEFGTVNTKFAFDTNSNLIPVALASEDSQVVDCVTGKMRYIANIAATTPAGIYATKVNYIAAPQY